ncbi:nickel/cobalt transporter [Sulfurospirillum deleyianum]|uniref:Nickel/cobalt efflux system n=1 Tax=Sulfurospirillum deleyianum (strain ATCC 51133 / DSM 6946 / 5175) TaxID=525898 RepID=D1B328_SULD5|nr:nickel transporter [Sulfurospirillum deleyianum]ACZ12498.1 high-affinity nickel-transporter [Sulfurospirillum deleyianum DSM 6946]
MSELYHTFLSYIIGWQKEINSAISDAFDTLETTQGSAMYGYIILVAFVYGLVHALGPGHGKMVIASYFLAHGAKLKDAFKVAFLTSLVHTLSALGVTTILYFFFQESIMKHFGLISENMYKISAVFILGIASFLLYEVRKEHQGCMKKEEEAMGKTTMLKIALSIGVVPCPGVMSIVLFAMILGYYTLGVASALSMSIGMGITMSIAAIATTRMKNASFVSSYAKRLVLLRYAGIFLLFIFGVLLLV